MEKPNNIEEQQVGKKTHETKETLEDIAVTMRDFAHVTNDGKMMEIAKGVHEFAEKLDIYTPEEVDKAAEINELRDFIEKKKKALSGEIAMLEDARLELLKITGNEIKHHPVGFNPIEPVNPGDRVVGFGSNFEPREKKEKPKRKAGF
jgi:hypothetical protein